MVGERKTNSDRQFYRRKSLGDEIGKRIFAFFLQADKKNNKIRNKRYKSEVFR